MGLEGEGAGLGTLDTTNSATPSGRTTPAAGGLGADLDSDSDVGMNSDSDSVREGVPYNADGTKQRVPQGAAASSGVAMGLFKPGGRQALAGDDNGSDALSSRRVTGHAELRKSISHPDDANAVSSSIGQFEEMKRRTPIVGTSLSSTMPSLSSTSNTDQLATLANSGSNGSTSPLQPPTGTVPNSQLFAKVERGDNSSALKASGYRVMDDIAIQGLGQGRGGKGLTNFDSGRPLVGSTISNGGGGGGTRSADTNILTSPVKGNKKKKLGGTKGSSSAKGRSS